MGEQRVPTNQNIYIMARLILMFSILFQFLDINMSPEYTYELNRVKVFSLLTKTNKKDS